MTMQRGLPDRFPPSAAARAARLGRKPKQAPLKANGVEDLRGMARALAIIEHLAVRPGRVVDVTHDLRLPWATVHRIIAQLTKADFLRRDPETKRYEIGPALWFAGATYMANHRVLRAALPYLHKAEQISGIAVQLAERVGRQAVAIYSAQPYATNIAKAQYGYHFPLHCGSKGRVLLAFAGPEFVKQYLHRPLEKLTDATLTDPDELRRELERIRQSGYSITVADVQPFTGSMAAPIRDASGTVVASLCFIARKTLIQNVQRRDTLLEHLLHAAHLASMDLGWRPDPV
ncbi:MAG TPA: IclR family transcriptional regulator [Xanthobacteraceae bacterium]|nr:IclR family transcriptional regulator [Xanthobacteraceae bacterium]